MSRKWNICPSSYLLRSLDRLGEFGLWEESVVIFPSLQPQRECVGNGENIAFGRGCSGIRLCRRIQFHGQVQDPDMKRAA